MPSKFSAAEKQVVIERILQSITHGSSNRAATEAAGIDASTFWLWCQSDSELKKRVSDIRIARVLVVEDALYENALHGGQQGKGVVAAQIFFLCNKAPQEWKNVQNIEVTSAPRDMSMEELLKRIPQGIGQLIDLRALGVNLPKKEPDV